ncbi:hypothetical protein SPBR_03057 [Sporothrix brasiliensis 5110]|uniref:Uncharacterized protein n=1 Tax=Sporothrix brasiliensis 5110 TaxID=1398154 RepID=A0A0C2J4S4_9PEZI|nr:uncharacterized protein SPBR_03057 [Sporothrix brasiliensis 5110]KIH92072.1 hypothetical protein SPBR_03057 [Sporothrix brasiliensis 5110]
MSEHLTKSASITFDPATNIPSLAGKTILITGTNSGLGKASALALAQHGPAQLWMTARDPEKGQGALGEVKNAAPGVNVAFQELDLSSFENIKAAVAAVRATTEKLDILMLNAGLMGCAPRLSPDGFEIQMATNHLGHALLLKLLQPILAPDARIVSLSSSAWKHSPPGSKIDFDTLRTASNDAVPPVFRYVQSKIANLLYAQQYAKHNKNTSQVMVSINPGEVNTNLFTREPGDDHMKKLQTEVVPKVAGPIADGVKNQLWAATTDAANLVNGAHYAPIGVEEKWGIAEDEELAEQLWAWTEEALYGQA